MSEEMLIEHCSPTLAGIKTGSLFSCKADNMEDIRRTIRALNRMLGKKGLRILPIRYRKGRALIYVYRPAYLSRDLGDTTAREILDAKGYVCENAEACIARLVKNLAMSDFSRLSARGCQRLYRKQSRRLQIRRILEGIR